MERRLLLATVLSLAVFLLYPAITGRGCAGPKPPPQDESTEQDDTTGKNGQAAKGVGNGNGNGNANGNGQGNGNDNGGPNPVASVPSEHPQRGVAASKAVLTSPDLKVTLTSQGGAVESVTLPKITEGDRSTPFDLIVPVDPTMLFGATDDTNVTPTTSPGGADRRELPYGPMRSPELQWTRDEAAEQASPDNDAVFTFTTPAGLVHTKRWILSARENDDQRRYDIALEMSVHAKDGAAKTQSVDVALLSSAGHLRADIRSAFANPSMVLWRDSSQADLIEETEQAFGIGIQELPQEGVNRKRLAVLGVRSAYFLSMYYRVPGPNEPSILHFWATGEDALERARYEENLARFWKDAHDIDVTQVPSIKGRLGPGVESLLHCWMVARLPVHASAADAAKNAQRFHFFVGPNERGVVRQDVYGPLDSVVTFPTAPDFVANILMWIYDFWFGLLGSAGLAVILMTLCVRGGLMPISVRNQLSMRVYGRKVAKLKPKVAELQKRYANNPKKMRDEQMRLYKEHGVGFPSGCLMMLIQIPIFFSLFSALRVEYTLRGASFLWIDDLAGPDMLIPFDSRVIDLTFFWVDGINLLPILMVALSIVHMRSMPKPADEQQAQQMKMMKWMPIIFAFILYNYTAALAIYMVFSSAFAIIESRIVRAKDEAAEAADAGKEGQAAKA